MASDMDDGTTLSSARLGFGVEPGYMGRYIEGCWGGRADHRHGVVLLDGPAGEGSCGGAEVHSWKKAETRLGEGGEPWCAGFFSSNPI